MKLLCIESCNLRNVTKGKVYQTVYKGNKGITTIEHEQYVYVKNDNGREVNVRLSRFTKVVKIKKENNLPTINDLRFGKIAATLAVEHSIQIARNKFDGIVLSEKIARALKNFRATVRAEKSIARIALILEKNN